MHGQPLTAEIGVGGVIGGHPPLKPLAAQGRQIVEKGVLRRVGGGRGEGQNGRKGDDAHGVTLCLVAAVDMRRVARLTSQAS